MNRAFLQPVVATDPRPTDPDLVRYVRSFLYLRILVGALGLALPVLLVAVERFWFDGDLLSSLSSYYYTGVRDVFVGALCAIGVFLIAYKVAEVNLDNVLSAIAGAGAALVALFPTNSGAGIPLTSLQDRLGETFVATVHYVSAAVFISSLAVLSFFYGKREGAREPRPGQQRSPAFWKTFHWACAGVIAAALVWMLGDAVFDWGPRRALLYGEWLSVWAFGVSWLWKGLEVDLLRGDRQPPT